VSLEQVRLTGGLSRALHLLTFLVSFSVALENCVSTFWWARAWNVATHLPSLSIASSEGVWPLNAIFAAENFANADQRMLWRAILVLWLEGYEETNVGVAIL